MQVCDMAALDRFNCILNNELLFNDVFSDSDTLEGVLVSGMVLISTHIRN